MTIPSFREAQTFILIRLVLFKYFVIRLFWLFSDQQTYYTFMLLIIRLLHSIWRHAVSLIRIINTRQWRFCNTIYLRYCSRQTRLEQIGQDTPMDITYQHQRNVTKGSTQRDRRDDGTTN